MSAPKALGFKPFLGTGANTWSIYAKDTPKESAENSMYMLYIDENEIGKGREVVIKPLDPLNIASWKDEDILKISKIKQFFICTVEFQAHGIVLGVRDELITRNIIIPEGLQLSCKIGETIHKIGIVSEVIQMSPDPKSVVGQKDIKPYMTLYEKFREASHLLLTKR